jgi:periplasmic divalent cation tolerance protein
MSGRARSRAVVILAAYPRLGPAERAARDLVASRLAACATVTPGGRAYYRWEGRLHRDTSVLLWGKTTPSKARAAIERIQKSHPDRVPEILVLPVTGGHAPYLAWLRGEVAEK